MVEISWHPSKDWPIGRIWGAYKRNPRVFSAHNKAVEAAAGEGTTKEKRRRREGLSKVSFYLLKFLIKIDRINEG